MYAGYWEAMKNLLFSGEKPYTLTSKKPYHPFEKRYYSVEIKHVTQNLRFDFTPQEVSTNAQQIVLCYVEYLQNNYQVHYSSRTTPSHFTPRAPPLS